MARTGGQALIDALKVHGATHAFCVPGESYLYALDALYDSGIQLITSGVQVARKNAVIELKM